MGTTKRPCHLLLLYEPSADHLVDRGFHECRADGFALPPTLTEVRNKLAVVAYVRLELRLSFKDSSMRRIAAVNLDQPFFSVYPSSIRTRFAILRRGAYWGP